MTFAGWLRAERQRRGWDVPEMARRLARSAGEARGGLPGDECLRQYVRRWERGKAGVSERYVLLYARAFGMEPGQLARLSTASPAAGEAPVAGAAERVSDPALLAVAEDIGAVLSREARADLVAAGRDGWGERAGVVAGERLLDAVEHVGLGRQRPTATAGGGRRVEHWHVTQVQAATGVFRLWDNEFGGGLRRKAVVGQLSEVTGLLAGPFSDEPTGRRLFAAVADLAQLAGWMSYDLGMHATAQRYYLLGMHLARDAGDRGQVARLVYCLARQMIDLGSYQDALDLAEAGLYRLRRTAAAKPAAMLHVIAARAHAGMRAAQPCQRSLGTAQDAFTRASAVSDPAWCGFFDEGELCGLIGVTLRDLALCDARRAARHATHARPWIERAIAGRPEAYTRSKVMDTDGLAVTAVLLGEHDEALTTLRTAVALAQNVASARVAARLARTLALARRRFPASAGIGEFGEQIEALATRA